jgi:pyridoxal phosphate phosphatase PHOSPHO2
MQWTNMMCSILKELHSMGIHRQQVEQVLERLPIHPGMIKGIQLAAASNAADLVILSDSNQVYIETVLKARQLNVFSSVITNPAWWDESGCLQIRWHTPESHSCGLCPKNLCKGQVLQKFLSEAQQRYERVVYLGDGWNDYCPATKLRETDLLLVRKGLSLEKKLRSTCEKLLAEIRYWENGDDVFEIFSTLLNEVSKLPN